MRLDLIRTDWVLSAIASDYGLSSQNLFASSLSHNWASISLFSIQLRQKFSSAAKRISPRMSDILFVLFAVFVSLVCIRVYILVRNYLVDFIRLFGVRIVVVT